MILLILFVDVVVDDDDEEDSKFVSKFDAFQIKMKNTR